MKQVDPVRAWQIAEAGLQTGAWLNRPKVPRERFIPKRNAASMKRGNVKARATRAVMLAIKRVGL